MNVIAICGSYRPGGVTAQLLEAAIDGAQEAGAQVERLTLRDLSFEFCRNCKTCWDPASQGKPVGDCPIRDDLTPWLERVAAADALVLAAPVNFSSLTALFKKFQERCLVLTELQPLPTLLQRLTGMAAAPIPRRRGPKRPMLCLTVSGAPAFFGRVLMPCAKKQFQAFGAAWSGRMTQLIWAGQSMSSDHVPDADTLDQARTAGRRLTISNS